MSHFYRWPRVLLRIAMALLLLNCWESPTRADIFRWDNGQLIPGTEGITPAPGVQLDHRGLEFAALQQQNLTGANFAASNLTRALLGASTLTNANMSGAFVTEAQFENTTLYGFTKEQLYSTRSYQARNLSGIGLGGNDLTGWDFTGQNLTNANFVTSALTNANLTGAVVAGAHFTQSRGFTKEQLYSTASDLQGIGLGGNALGNNDLTGWDFSGQNLANAFLGYAILTNANLNGAVVTGADFENDTSRGITKEQLYSTASYQEKNLQGIQFWHNDLSGWDFSAQNLTGAGLNRSTLTNTNLTGAVVTGAKFLEATSRGFTKEQLYSTASYQAKNLQGIGFWGNDLSGWDFSGQNLTGASFYLSQDNQGTNLSNANLSGADARGASGLNLAGAIATNLIQPDGRIDGLSLGAGERLVAYAGVPIPVQLSAGFSIAPDATFDLTDNDLIVRATAATKDAMHAEIQAKFASAQNGTDENGVTNWNGPGITTSSARNANVATGFDLVGLGVIRNSDLEITTGSPGSTYTTFSGVPVSTDDVLVKYTYVGDGNLDGIINFDDYVGMDNAFFGLIPNLGWATGDSNFDGLINFDDYSAVDQAFFTQGASLHSSVSAIPEPAGIALVGVGLLVMELARLARRRRVLLSLSAAIALGLATSARAAIFRWDNGQLIPGTEGITLGASASIASWNRFPAL